MNTSKKRSTDLQKKYNIGKLIYFEVFDMIDLAIARERQIKGYSRKKKLALVNKINPAWNELSVSSTPSPVIYS